MDRRSALKTTIVAGFGLLTSRKALADCVTTSDIEGPYYIANAKLTSKLAPSGAAGTKLFITGSVYANDCKTAIPGAVVDVWHANDAGGYENVDYRGVMESDHSGKYAFETILPGKYLNGAQYRPRHLHYKVSAPDIDKSLVLTTQIYFKGDTSIPIDPWASDDSAKDRIVPLVDENGDVHGVVDVVLDIDPGKVTSVKRLARTQTGIESIYPSPLVSNGHVRLNLAQSGTVSIRAFSLAGKEVFRVADSQALGAGSHDVEFSPNDSRGIRIPSGIYILKLWFNGQAVDVKRMMVH